MPTVLILGGRGALGAACAERFAAGAWEVLVTSRSGGPDALRVDVPPHGEADLSALDDVPPLDSVVWAQGTNRNDSAKDFDLETHRALQSGNTTFVAATLHRLLATERLATGARLVVVSSVWQQLARPDKLSYTVSKAALGGLVRALAADLASRGVLVNAVLPGVVDTAMTRAVLTAEQMTDVTGSTGFGRLVTPAEVAATVWFLGAENTAVTGQSLTVDLGFTTTRRL